MSKTTTPNMALRLQSGWRNRLGNGSSRWFAPLGLILMLFALFVPNIASAEIVTKTYDFSSNGTTDTEVTYSNDNTIKIGSTTCNYFTKIGSVEGADRFAAQGAGSWILISTSNVRQRGLYNNNGGGRLFVVSRLTANDIVTFNIQDAYGNVNNNVWSVSSGNGTKNGSAVTMTANGDLAISLDRYFNIVSITIQHEKKDPVYAYQYSTETYDLTGKNWTISQGADAGYKFYEGSGGYDACYISNPTGYELNNRVVIMKGLAAQYANDNGLKVIGNNNRGVRIIGINDLHEGDRVKVTFTGTGTFSSLHINNLNEQFSATGKVFYDADNDGQQDGFDDIDIVAGTPVESEAVYTMLAPGHLDLAFAAGSIITKIEIISDRSCGFINTKNSDGSYSLTFDGTGELENKSAYVGGLMVELSNAQKSNEAVNVTAGDHGYKSYCNDQDGFKMARRSDQGTDLAKAPTSGTFYQFTPEVDGTLKIDFKALSVKYGAKIWSYDPSDEEITDANCPYYFIETDDNGNLLQPYQDHIKSVWKSNGAWVENFANGIEVEAGHTYYFYGWWADESKINESCGVAQMVKITFKPSFFISPLAKVIENGTTTDTNLATVVGTNPTVSVKRKSDNITACTPTISNGTLQISDIAFANDADKAGVILLEVADGSNVPQVFALTIAYSASYNNGQGHKWDFHSEPLEIGRYFQDWFSNVSDDGRGYVNNYHPAGENGNTGNDYYDQSVLYTGSTLYSEMSEDVPDWDLVYARKVLQKDGSYQYTDPMFSNVYDMEGDNADMLWETGGLWFHTSPHQSCFFNEKIGDIDRTDGTQIDPDRYVGIRQGGEFRIPKLKKDDRVIIYMGSAKGSGAGEEESGGKRTLLLNIENARDAVYQEINSNDIYWVGGSLWNTWQLNGDNHEDPNYRGCYHFFAKEDGDMVFKLNEGALCKIYSIEIYHDGTHHYTNNIQVPSDSHYDLWNNDTQTYGADGDNNHLNIHYRGKGEKVAGWDSNSSIKNEILTYSGKISNTTVQTLSNQQVGYTSKVGDFGTMLMRVKVMDYNHKYVTDFGDRNLTVGYIEKKSYPYTWDFTDMQGFSRDDIEAEDTNYPNIPSDVAAWEDPKIWDLSMWDEDGYMNIYNKNTSITGAELNAHYVFANNKYGGGNQLWANGKIIPETQGLMFYMDNNDPAYNGCMQITDEGLRLANESYENGATCQPGESMRRGWWNYKMVIPNVDAGAAVYLRAARDESVKEGDISFQPWSSTNGAYVDVTETFFYKSYQFDGMENKVVIGSDGNSKLYEANDGSGDYIMAIFNSGAEADLTLTLNGWILKKMSVSTDRRKTLDSNGWATESRNHVTDPSLTAYLTGYNIETCFVNDYQHDAGAGKPGKVVLSRADLTDTKDGQLIRAAADGNTGAVILHNTAGEPVSILDGGFHLFVPDMHDFEGGDFTNNNAGGIKTITTTANGILKAQVTEGDIPQTTGDYTNYVLSSQYYKSDQGDLISGPESFYRVSSRGAHSYGNNGYLPILTSEVANPANAYEIVFDLDNEADGINEVNNSKAATIEGVYTIDGQKLEGMPTNSGLYIINGKKVVIK